MSNQHTPGPWKTEDGITTDLANIYGPNGELIVGGEYDGLMAPFAGRPREEAKANARRIVACVNACEGLSVEEVENLDAEGALDGLSLREDQVRKVTEQRDELLAALIAVQGWADEQGIAIPVRCNARAAIAKVPS